MPGMRFRKHRLVAVAFTVVALAAGGCAAGTPDGSEGADGPAGADSAAAPPAASGEPEGTAGPAGPEATPETLAFRAATVGGGELHGADLVGQPVAFWFWAAWCTRCAAAAGDVAAVQTEFDGRVHVVGVAGLGSSGSGMERFVDRHGLDGFAHLADDAGEVWRRFGVTSQEFFVILDASGEVVHQGPLSPSALREQLHSLAG
jgi:peroxiredoxin